MAKKKTNKDYEDFRYELHLTYEECDRILRTLRHGIDKVNFVDDKGKGAKDFDEKCVILEDSIYKQMKKTIKITRQKIRNG